MRGGTLLEERTDVDVERFFVRGAGVQTQAFFGRRLYKKGFYCYIGDNHIECAAHSGTGMILLIQYMTEKIGESKILKGEE